MTAPRLPERIGEYAIESVLGEGGMATVYLARERITDRRVALKVIQGGHAHDQEFIARFILEVRASVGMRHENIVEVFTCGEQDGRYYMACELVEKGSLRELKDRIERCPAPLAVELLAQLLSGLSYAHGKGVIHRDLKPANLLLTARGQLKICDFGISKSADAVGMTKTNALLGTPAYMSPEQAMGSPLDPRSDLFSAGVIFYELLSGMNPFQADAAGATIARILAVEAPSIADREPTIPDVAEHVLERLLQKDAKLRYASANEALADLADYLTQVRANYPGIVAESLIDPAALRTRVNHQQASECLAEAQLLLKKGPAEQNQAALCLYRGVLLDPGHAEVSRLFNQVAAQVHARFVESTNPKIVELEAQLKTDPNQAVVLQQLAQLYRIEGNLHRAVTCYKRYLKIRPKDGYVAGQLSQLVGNTKLTLIGDRTRDLVADIKTGGFAAQPRAGSTPGARPPSTPGALPPPSATPMFTPPARSPSIARGAPKESGFPTKLVGIAVVVLALVFGVRGIGRFINKSQAESVKNTQVFDRARAEAERPQEKQDSEQALKDRLEVNASDAVKRFEDASGMFARGDYAGAITACDALINKYPKRPQATLALLIKGKALFESDHLSDAVEALDELVSQHAGIPEIPEAILVRGKVRAKRGQNEQALADFDLLLREHATSPFTTEATVGRGEAHAALGHKDDAIVDFKSALGKTGPSDPLHVRAEAGLAAIAPQ